MPLPNAKAAANALAAQSRADMLLIAERIQDGEGIAVIRADFRRAIVRAVTAQSALGRGGWERVDKERAGKLAAVQFDYLEGFLKDVFAGKVTPVRVAQRAAMYADSTRPAYENERVENQKDEGFTLAARLLGAADHCTGCVEAAAAGWVSIDDVLPIGDAECGGKCFCTIIYRRNENSPTAPAATRAIEAAQTKQQAYQAAKAAKETADE